jgi:hypothetical protein
VHRLTRDSIGSGRSPNRTEGAEKSRPEAPVRDPREVETTDPAAHGKAATAGGDRSPVDGRSRSPEGDAVDFTLEHLDIECSLANPWISASVVLAIVAASVLLHRVLWSQRSRGARILLIAGALLGVLLSPALGMRLSVAGQWQHTTRSTQIGCISISRTGPWHLILPWAALLAVFETTLLLRRRRITH